MKRGALLLLAPSAMLAAAGGAQAPRFEPPGAVTQIAPASTPAEDIGSGQIGDTPRSVATGDAAASRDARPAPQLAAPRDAAAPAQLVRETPTARGSAQLSGGPKSAQPSAPLSTPAEGRTGTVAKVEGRDRCDPSARIPAAAPVPAPGRSRLGRAGRVVVAPEPAVAVPAASIPCGRVIETRGGDFPPPGIQPLSPEQRLLVEQRQPDSQGAEAGAIARTAARTTGRDGADAGAPEMQGLASVVLAPPPVTPQPTSGLTPEQAAIVTSVLGAISGGQR